MVRSGTVSYESQEQNRNQPKESKNRLPKALSLYTNHVYIN